VSHTSSSYNQVWDEKDQLGQPTCNDIGHPTVLETGHPMALETGHPKVIEASHRNQFEASHHNTIEASHRNQFEASHLFDFGHPIAVGLNPTDDYFLGQHCYQQDMATFLSELCNEEICCYAGEADSRTEGIKIPPYPGPN
jgi:hypothetical protein